MSELTSYLESAGISSPLTKVCTDQLDMLPLTVEALCFILFVHVSMHVFMCASVPNIVNSVFKKFDSFSPNLQHFGTEMKASQFGIKRSKVQGHSVIKCAGNRWA